MPSAGSRARVTASILPVGDGPRGRPGPRRLAHQAEAVRIGCRRDRQRLIRRRATSQTASVARTATTTAMIPAVPAADDLEAATADVVTGFGGVVMPFVGAVLGGDALADAGGTLAVSAATMLIRPYPYWSSRPGGPLSMAVAVKR